MSVTYTDHDHTRRDEVVEEAYVPVYARRRAARGRTGPRGVKAWMILAPLGLAVVGGITAAMLMNGGEAGIAAVPAAPAPAVAQAPLTDLMATTASGNSAALTAMRPPEPATPVAATRASAPVPLRRAAPVQRRAAPATVSAGTTATDDAGDEATAELNRAQAARASAGATTTTAPAPSTDAPRAPAIQVQPFPSQ